MKILLEPDKYYHIYNHANGKENLFVNEGNYHFFMERYAKYINPIADTFAYCLMPNHFHFAIRIKSEEQLSQLSENSNLFELSESLELSKSSKRLDYSKVLSKQFSNLFSSYTQAFNKQQNRMGSLFIPNFSRKLIDSDTYFKQLIYYIHFNPVHHGFVNDLRDCKHSSFETLFSEKATNLKREELIEWFDDKDNFWTFHQKKIDTKMIVDFEK